MQKTQPSFDDHAFCPQCRVAAGTCHVDVSNPCTICENWTTRTWNKLRKSLVDARLRTTRRERQHWTSAFPYIRAWIANKPASAATSSEPGSEISSFVDSGDDFSDKLIASTTGPLTDKLIVHESIGVTTNMAGIALPSTVAAIPLTEVALPMAPGTIHASGHSFGCPTHAAH